MTDGQPALLRMSGVSKRFGATQALSDVSMEIARGQVRALIGENGAGKSTLMKVLSGVYQPDSGRMERDGHAYRPTRPVDGRDAGIAMIYQELNLAPHLSVVDNVMLGQERSQLGVLRWAEQIRVTREALGQLTSDQIPLDKPAGDLPIAKQQLIEIARALVSNARVIIFDEPTSSLTEHDSQQLFQVIHSLRERGLGIVYISHFLEEVAQVADVFTVLRDGKVVGEGTMDDVTLDDIVRLMVGRELDDLFPHVPHSPSDAVLDLDQLCGNPIPRDATLQLRRGEILGLAGLIGAGRSELVRCIYGLEPIQRGKVSLEHVGRVGISPRHSIQAGLGLVSENRKDEGLAVDMSICDNLTFTRLKPYRRLGWLNLRKRRAAVAEWLTTVQCKAASVEQTIGELSGGNQQKIAIARLLHQQSDVLLLDEPTRGIDIGTKAEVYRLVGQLAADGRAVLMVSSYLPELLNVCDRIGVMCRGQLVEVRDATDWDEHQIMHRATGLETAT